MDNPFADPSVAESSGTYEPPADGLGSLEFHTEAAQDAPWLESGAESHTYESSFSQGQLGANGGAEGDDVPLFQDEEVDDSAGATSTANGGLASVAKIKDAITDIATAPLPKLIQYMRMANVAVASMMVASAFLTLIGTWSLSVLVISVYVACFGCMLCCFETHAKTVSAVLSENFGFMYSAKGRFVFLVLLSTLCFGLDLLGKITACALCLVALLNLYVILKFPEYAKGGQVILPDQNAPETLTVRT